MSLSWRRYCLRAELTIKFGTDKDVITDTNDTHEPNICSNTLCITPAAWIPKHRLVIGVRVTTFHYPSYYHGKFLSHAASEAQMS